MPKRLLDVLLSASGLLFLSPVFVVVAYLIKREDGGVVFFAQERVGLGGVPFRIYKFRTMRETAGGGFLTVGGDSRITRIGYFLRKYKLDEIPQLLNVLKGELSLVGPRPEVPYYVAKYSKEQRDVLTLMPGITDPASIRFRNENELLAGVADPESVYVTQIMAEKIKLNLDYASKATFWSDLGIIFQTLQTVVRG